MNLNPADIDIDRTCKMLRYFLTPASLDLIELLEQKKSLSKTDILEIMKPKHFTIGVTLKRLTDYFILDVEFIKGNWYYSLNYEVINSILAVIKL
jgi:hypothetical protein